MKAKMYQNSLRLVLTALISLSAVVLALADEPTLDDFRVIAVDSWLESAAPGDLNGDGAADIGLTGAAYINRNDALILMPQQGGGLALPADFSAGKKPVAGTGGDFNNDGRSDFATVNGGDDTVGVWWGCTCKTAPGTWKRR